MTTVSQLASRLNTLLTLITPAYSKLADAYSEYKSNPIASPADLKFMKEVREIDEQKEAYDREFVEAESKIQAAGGIKRRQTLQEFVLLFFFVSFGIFTAALVAHSFIRGDYFLALKTVLLMIVICLACCGLIIQQG